MKNAKFGAAAKARSASGRLSALLASVCALSLLSAPQAGKATTYSIPADQNLKTFSPAPLDGDVWNLQGNAKLFMTGTPWSSLTMPASLTINGLTTGSTITLNDGVGDYGSFYSTSNTTLTLSNLTITGGAGPTSAAIGTYAGASLTLNLSGSMTFSNNAITGAASGAALYSNGTMTINGGATFNNNTVIFGTNANYGGAVFAQGALTFTDSTQTIAVTNNSAYGGGGLNSGGALTIAGGLVLDNNTANTSNGGGIRTVNGNVSIAATAGNVSVTRNTVTRGGASGGGIYAGTGNVSIGNSAGSVTIGGSAVNANTATAGGGGIYAGNGTVGITGNVVTVSHNKATAGNGGGIYAAGGGTISGGTVTASNNSASAAGGAIYAGGTVTANGNISMDGNFAGTTGGAVSVSAGDVKLAATSGSIALTNNIATTHGGAVFYNGATGTVSVGNTSGVTTITGNKAGYNSSGTLANSTSNGGAVNSGNTATLSGSTIALSNNIASAAGGGVYAAGAVTVNGNLTANANVAQVGNGGAIAAAGDVTLNGGISADNDRASDRGGVIFSAGSVKVTGMSNSVISLTNNSAANGGGAFYTQAGNIGLSGVFDTVTVTNNKVTGSSANGGAFSSFAGAISLTAATVGDITITGNTATGGGGAFYGQSGITFSPLQAGNLIVSDNVAQDYGGGAFATNGTNAHINVGGTYGSLLFANNRATTGYGGAFTVVGGTGSSVNFDVTTTGTMKFSNNYAKLNGGAINSVTASVQGDYGSIVFDGNIAETGHGGAVHANTITIDTATSGSLTLTNNRAGQYGGATNSYATQILGSYGSILIDGNTAGAAGGAMHGTSITINTATVESFTLTNNSAGMSGGAVDSSDTSILGSYGSVLIGRNTAATTGGAISSSTGDITVNATVLGTMEISGNTAGKGGALAANNAGITISGGYGGIVVDANKALTGNGGAFYASGNVSVRNASGPATITGNTAGLDGGAVYAGADFTLDAAGPALFSGNHAAGKGGAIWAGNMATLVASTGDVTFTGNTHEDPTANAIYLNNTAGTGGAIFDAAAGRTIAFFDPVQSNPGNGKVSVVKTGDGMVSFDGSRYGAEIDRWSRVYGDTEVRAGTFEVTNNGIYGALSTDAATPTAATSFISSAGTMVQGGGVGTLRADNVTLDGDLSIAGRHQPITDYSVFNVSTNALTLGGGNVYFNTYLNDGVVQNTDLLVLDLHGSATSGQSLIVVRDTGGPGMLTVGDGIKLVETNGTGTTAGAFALGGRVAAGAYEYLLFYGGNASAGGNPDDQNWYLRNTYIPAPTPDNPDPQPVPIIRPEVPVSMVIPPLAIEYGYAMLDTLHERVGETYLHKSGPATEERLVWCKDPQTNFKCVVRVPVATANGAGKDEARWASSGWARLIGNRGEHQPDNFMRRGPNYDYTFGGIQAGLDVYAREQADGTLDKAGLYVGYGQISSNVKGQFGGKAGSVDMDAYTVGGYWMHHSPQGWYTDAVIQGTWYAADAKSIYGQQLKPDGFGILGSLEAGYAFKLGNGWTMEPQAQIVYQNVSFDHARDAYGFARFDDGDSLRGRLGLRLTKSWNQAEEGRDPRFVTAWLRANVWHEFLGKTKTSWGSLDGRNLVPFNTYLGGTWGEIGAGVTAQITDKVDIFATGAYNCSLDGKGREGWDGRLGMTVRW